MNGVLGEEYRKVSVHWVESQDMTEPEARDRDKGEEGGGRELGERRRIDGAITSTNSSTRGREGHRGGAKCGGVRSG